jgi:hypothetical protein
MRGISKGLAILEIWPRTMMEDIGGGNLQVRGSLALGLAM